MHMRGEEWNASMTTSDKLRTFLDCHKCCKLAERVAHAVLAKTWDCENWSTKYHRRRPPSGMGAGGWRRREI